jgi:hypothetical protein
MKLNIDGAVAEPKTQHISKDIYQKSSWLLNYENHKSPEKSVIYCLHFTKQSWKIWITENNIYICKYYKK